MKGSWCSMPARGRAGGQRNALRFSALLKPRHSTNTLLKARSEPVQQFPGALGHTGAFFRAGQPHPHPHAAHSPAGTRALMHCSTNSSVPISAQQPRKRLRIADKGLWKMEWKVLTNKADLEQSRRARCWGACREGGRSEEREELGRIQVGTLGEGLGAEQGWGWRNSVMRALGSETPRNQN